MTDLNRDLRRIEGPSPPAGRPTLGEAKPLRLRRIGPEGPEPGEALAGDVVALAAALRPARTGARLQALTAALLSLLLVGSFAALGLIGGGGLPGTPPDRPPTPLVREVEASTIEAVPGARERAVIVGEPEPGLGAEFGPAFGVVPGPADEPSPPGVLPQGGGYRGDEGQDQDGETEGQGGGGDQAGGKDQTGGLGDGNQGVQPGSGSGQEAQGDQGTNEGLGMGHEKAKGKGHGTGKGKGHEKDGEGDGTGSKGKGKDKGPPGGGKSKAKQASAGGTSKGKGPASAPPNDEPPAQPKGSKGKGNGG